MSKSRERERLKSEYLEVRGMCPASKTGHFPPHTALCTPASCAGMFVGAFGTMAKLEGANRRRHNLCPSHACIGLLAKEERHRKIDRDTQIR